MRTKNGSISQTLFISDAVCILLNCVHMDAYQRNFEQEMSRHFEGNFSRLLRAIVCIHVHIYAN